MKKRNLFAIYNIQISCLFRERIIGINVKNPDSDRASFIKALFIPSLSTTT